METMASKLRDQKTIHPGNREELYGVLCYFVVPWCRVATPHDVTGSAAMAACLAACRGRLPPHTERAGRRPLAKEAGFRLQGAGFRTQVREPGERSGRRMVKMLVFAARRVSCQEVVHPGAQRSVSCSRGCPVGRSCRAASLRGGAACVYMPGLPHARRRSYLGCYLSTPRTVSAATNVLPPLYTSPSFTSTAAS